MECARGRRKWRKNDLEFIRGGCTPPGTKRQSGRPGAFVQSHFECAKREDIQAVAREGTE